jgi:hypothetical protein
VFWVLVFPDRLSVVPRSGGSDPRFAMFPSALSESGYFNEVRLVDSEIEEAIIVFHTVEEINQLALRDTRIYRVLNEEPMFWQAYRSTCQTALFMGLGRIFDSSPGGHSIQKVISSTMENFAFFSKTALRTRRMSGRTDEPEWLSEFVAAAWQPERAADLRFLKHSLKPYVRMFEEVYRPIRHAIYGHRLMTNDEAGSQLFPHTNREAVGKMLDFLHDLIESVIDLYNNGKKPRLGQRDFTGHNERIRDGARNVLRKLAQ